MENRGGSKSSRRKKQTSPSPCSRQENLQTLHPSEERAASLIAAVPNGEDVLLQDNLWKESKLDAVVVAALLKKVPRAAHVVDDVSAVAPAVCIFSDTITPNLKQYAVPSKKTGGYLRAVCMLHAHPDHLRACYMQGHPCCFHVREFA